MFDRIWELGADADIRYDVYGIEERGSSRLSLP